MSSTDTLDTTTPATDHRGRVPRSKFVYFAALAALAGLWGFVGYSFMAVSFTFFGIGWNLGALIWVFGVFHFLTGIRVVDIEHIVGVYFLGFPTIQVSGSFIVVPAGIFQTTENELKTHEDEFPDEPENIWRANPGESVAPAGKKPPIRIPFSDPQDSYPLDIVAPNIRKNDPLHRRTTNEVSFISRWRILDEFDFRRNIGTLKMARDQMEDIGVSFLSEVLTRMTPTIALLNLEKINRAFESRMRQKTSHWGIEIVDGRVKLIEFSHNLNSSIQGIARSEADAQGVVFTAEGERQKRILEGEGAASAVAAELKARGDGLKELAAKLDLEPKDVLAAEVARDVANGQATKIILPGMGEMLNFASGIANNFKKSSSTGETKT